MRDDWIFDVLEDLHNFALTNGLPALAAQIHTAQQVAEAEISALAENGDEARGRAMANGGGRPN
ncbi:hypothetical protein D2N39_08730 [Gemmobacter lutimaris]|uniref:Uncharacterized protein n=1 Tax=Gemmobacter lutimaris TaxID=2306023 RepID=A0A398BQI8_9RHOB|nr:hypothetical protein [Gemmobacter lutimaris]RID91994.1 hypothetical protein D2N39_08730 [Gemmobacter lutimaris]